MTIKSNILNLILTFTILGLISCNNSTETEAVHADEDTTALADYTLHYRTARDLQNNLKFDSAIVEYKKCIFHDYKGDSDSILYITTQAMMQVMNCYQSKGEPDNCVKFFRNLPDSCPYIRNYCMRDYYSIFGYALSRTENMTEAEQTISKALGMKLYRPTHKRLFRDYSYAAAVFYCNPKLHEEVVRLSKLAIEEARQSNNTTGVQWVTSLLGNVYKRTGQIDEAFDLFQESIEESKRINDDMGEINAYNAMAGLCLYWHIPYYADFCANMAIKEAETTDKRNPMVAASAYINKGMAMQQLNKFDSAFYYYDKADQYCQELPYNSGQVDIDLQKGIYLTSNGSSDSLSKGIEVLKTVTEQATPTNRAKAYHQLALVYLNRGNDAEAEQMLDSMYTLLNKTEHSIFIGIDYDKIINHYFDKGDFAKAKQYTKYMLDERMFNIDNGVNMKMSGSIVKIHTERMEKELRIANRKLYNSQLTLRTYILALAIVLVVAMLMFFYKHRLLRLRMQLANEKLVELTHQLDQLLVEKAEHSRKDSATTSNSMPTADSSDNNDLSADMLNDKDESSFRQRFEMLYPTFLPNLRQRTPLIGRREELLCMLIFLRLDNHQIASLMTIALRSVHMLRHRLRQKMNLNKDESLEEVISEMAKAKESQENKGG